MNHNDPYAKLGGGALDQELFKNKQTPPSAQVSDTSDKKVHRSKTHVTPPSRQKSENNESKSLMTDVMTSSLHDVNLRAWRDTIENTETHNSSLRLTTEEGDGIEDLIKELKRKLKVKTSLNEVARLGLLYILHDFKKCRDNSLIYKVKKS
jgi:hypothetical protein